MFNCKYCELNQEIQTSKARLNMLIEKKHSNLLDKSVIYESQKLDALISKCVYCNRSTKLLEKHTTTTNFHFHGVFYYSGDEHLLLNIIQHIKQKINKNELVYLFMDPILYMKIINILSTDSKIENIKFFKHKHPTKDYSLFDIKNTERCLKYMEEDALSNGYSGVFFIGQPSYAIKKYSKKDFLEFENILNQVLKNKKISFLCIYDLEDYLNGQLYIDNLVMSESLETHDCQVVL
ncbi:MAG: MEDS domain-containing protein [Clostridiaceae bacterium]